MNLLKKEIYIDDSLDLFPMIAAGVYFADNVSGSATMLLKLGRLVFPTGA